MNLTNLYDFEKEARNSMQLEHWTYVSAGAHDDQTLKRNESALQDLSIYPRFLRDVTNRDLSTTVLGQQISFPVATAASGPWYYAHPDAEVAVAKAAERSGTISMQPTNAGTFSFAEVAASTNSPLWLQLYHSDDEITEYLVTTAADHGCKAICLTIDIPISGSLDPRLRSTGLLLPKLLQDGNLRERPDLVDKYPKEGLRTLTWDRLEWLKSLTGLPLVLKGIRTVDDSIRAVDHGVDGILVSTHGGRYLDGSSSAIEILPQVYDAVGTQIEVYMDSGIRRGTDVLKALALGAQAVFIGRPVFWGLAVDGENGVYSVLEILRRELDMAMAFCGITRVPEIDGKILSWN
tara:strand:- start:202 stop:1248 length:1047 start_codon:yes stop_codon:yes gene_type:complete